MVKVSSTLPVLVVAGNSRQYQNFLMENGYNPADYIYVDSPADVRGVSQVMIQYVGEYWLNPLYKSEDLEILFRLRRAHVGNCEGIPEEDLCWCNPIKVTRMGDNYFLHRDSEGNTILNDIENERRGYENNN